MEEFTLFNRIKQRDRNAFDALFRKYYTSLCRFSLIICQSQKDAEESVQDMFVNLWEKAPLLQIETSVKAYLYTSTRNYTLNTINKQQTELRYLNEYTELMNNEEADQKISSEEISILIQQGVNTLPDKCREIFVLCKQEGLTYDEIATYLNISEKTVENQMGIALRKLREYLMPRFQRILLVLFFYLFF
ncbi:RNA polymerase sigma-70 factor [Bacteroides sp. 519]|uniref:RNA polymerase sigma-70 factor n=1 Tax=Bacteroides sp. 519 TaxID=2302937 RepID=UPI0013D02D24|nr:RNA polymerase sigma-70 factor [Bacteroides sp. 519]